MGALEHVVDERVHDDGHAALGDTGVGVHLLEHAVDVGRVGLGPLALPLLVAGLLGRLGGRDERTCVSILSQGGNTCVCACESPHSPAESWLQCRGKPL